MGRRGHWQCCCLHEARQPEVVAPRRGEDAVGGVAEVGPDALVGELVPLEGGLGRRRVRAARLVAGKGTLPRVLLHRVQLQRARLGGPVPASRHGAGEGRLLPMDELVPLQRPLAFGGVVAT